MTIQIKWWSRLDDDPAVTIQIKWWSRLDDDPVVMIQIEWWSRSSEDNPDRVMIQIQMKMTWRWRWPEDEDDLKMNMTWRWRWRELDDDSDDTEKKTCADKLCRENTFLVKRECWCIFNFGMYSLVYLMYYTPMFILGSVCNVFETCHAPMFLSRDSIM